MKLGVHVVSFDVDGGPAAIGPTLARVGESAEQAGVDNLSVMDHYLQITGNPTAPMLEGYTTLGFLAAHTRTAEPRRGLVRARTRRARDSVPTVGRAVRAAGGDSADRPSRHAAGHGR
jgi:hypothetical protein